MLAVLVANQFAFSNGSVIGARVLLFLGLAFALAAALIVPVIRLNRRRAARAAEALTRNSKNACSRSPSAWRQNPADPFLHLLADDTLHRARRTRSRSRWPSNTHDLQLLLRCRSVADRAALAGHVRPRIPWLRHFAAVGRHSEGRHQALLRHPRGPRATRPCASAPTS